METNAAPAVASTDDKRAWRTRQLAALGAARIANAWPRLGASAVAALVAASVVGVIWPTLWGIGLAIIVAIDRALFQRVVARCAAGAEVRMRPLIAWTVAQSAYGNLLSPLLWFAPLPQGETLAVLMFCGGFANAAVSLRTSPPLLLAAVAPTVIMLLGLPLYEFATQGDALELLPMVGGLVLLGYSLQLWRSLAESDAARLEAEAAVLRERQAASAAAASKAATVAQINDAVRTPLAALKGGIEHLWRVAATPNARQQLAALAQAHAVVQRALGDVSDCDAAARGALALAPAPCDPRALLRAIINAFRPAAQDKHLELFADIAPNAPVLVELDALRVRQVLCNLIANAIAATTHGGVRVRLAVEPMEAPGVVRLVFYVADTGVGMSRSQVAQLFNHAGPGGRGLAVSKAVAAAMGGVLTAKSALGEGSIVCFALPVAVQVQAQGDAGSAQAFA